MRQRIEKNHALISFLIDDRCHSHMVYINFLSTSKQFLRLLAFLKEAIDSYNVVQIEYFSGVLEVFLEDFSVPDDHAVKTMLTQLKNIKIK